MPQEQLIHLKNVRSDWIEIEGVCVGDDAEVGVSHVRRVAPDELDVTDGKMEFAADVPVQCKTPCGICGAYGVEVLFIEIVVGQVARAKGLGQP